MALVSMRIVLLIVLVATVTTMFVTSEEQCVPCKDLTYPEPKCGHIDGQLQDSPYYSYCKMRQDKALVKRDAYLSATDKCVTCRTNGPLICGTDGTLYSNECDFRRSKQPASTTLVPKDNACVTRSTETCVVSGWGDPHLWTCDGFAFDLFTTGTYEILRSDKNQFFVHMRTIRSVCTDDSCDDTDATTGSSTLSIGTKVVVNGKSYTIEYIRTSSQIYVDGELRSFPDSTTVTPEQFTDSTNWKRLDSVDSNNPYEYQKLGEMFRWRFAAENVDSFQRTNIEVFADLTAWSVVLPTALKGQLTGIAGNMDHKQENEKITDKTGKEYGFVDQDKKPYDPNSWTQFRFFSFDGFFALQIFDHSQSFLLNPDTYPQGHILYETMQRYIQQEAINLHNNVKKKNIPQAVFADEYLKTVADIVCNQQFAPMQAYIDRCMYDFATSTTTVAELEAMKNKIGQSVALVEHIRDKKGADSEKTALETKVNNLISQLAKVLEPVDKKQLEVNAIAQTHRKLTDDFNKKEDLCINQRDACPKCPNTIALCDTANKAFIAMNSHITVVNQSEAELSILRQAENADAIALRNQLTDLKAQLVALESHAKALSH